MFSIKKLQLSMLILLLAAGCALFAPDPHENFLEIMHSMIGEKWNELPRTQYPDEKDLISSQTLSNGNIERKYRVVWGLNKNRICTRIYEIDPKTDIIVNVGFEGKNEDCVINP